MLLLDDIFRNKKGDSHDSADHAQWYESFKTALSRVRAVLIGNLRRYDIRIMAVNSRLGSGSSKLPVVTFLLIC